MNLLSKPIVLFKKSLGYFKEVHSEDGSHSWMRVCGSVIIGSVLAVFIAHNAMSLYRGTGYQDFGLESVGVILSVLGTKVWQRKTEGQE